MKRFWTCLNCHEQIESQFEVCWNCQHNQSGGISPIFTSLDPDDEAERKRLTEIWRDKHCAACNSVLTYVGTKEYYEESTLGLLGDLVQRLGDAITLQMYSCPTCGQDEYFV